jgi:hypothetical protein
MVLQSGGFQDERTLLQTPTEHRDKNRRTVASRSYSSRWVIATRNIDWGSTTWNHTG